jgi:hypothetical protein
MTFLIALNNHPDTQFAIHAKTLEHAFTCFCVTRTHFARHRHLLALCLCLAGARRSDCHWSDGRVINCIGAGRRQ